jgi:ribonuclease-3
LEESKTDFILEQKTAFTSSQEETVKPERKKDAAQKAASKSAVAQKGTVSDSDAGLKATSSNSVAAKATESTAAAEPSSMEEEDEFDLSDISHNPRELSREEIIAAAEAAAFSDQT